MVFGGDFKVALVDAHTKQPFLEHYRDGQTHVEVEPDVEYYVSLQRIQTSFGGVIVTCKVDGKDLGWQRNYQANQIDMKPHYNGSSSFNYSNVDPTGYYRKQQEKRTALVFEKAKIRMVSNTNRRGGGEGEDVSSTSSANTVVPMGKVEFNIFQMGNPFTLMGCDNLFISDIAAKSEEAGDGVVSSSSTLASAVTNKKQVRSSLGKYTDDTVVESGNGIRLYGHSKGKLLQTITLNYTTVPGLISAGILSKTEADFQRINTAVVVDPTGANPQQVQQLYQQLPSNPMGSPPPQQGNSCYQPGPSMSFGGMGNTSPFHKHQVQPGVVVSLAASIPQAMVSTPMDGRVAPQMNPSGGATHHQNSNNMMMQAPAGDYYGGENTNDPLHLLNSVQGAYGQYHAAPSNRQIQQQQQHGGGGYQPNSSSQNYWYPPQYGGGQTGGHSNAEGGQQQGHGYGGY